MYRVNPFTYLVSSLLGSTLGGAPVTCAENELKKFSAPEGQTCGEYLQGYMSLSGGNVINPEAAGDELCQFCSMKNTNDFLTGISVDYNLRWRNWGIFCAYIVFNIGGAIFLYWLARVPKGKKKVKST